MARMRRGMDERSIIPDRRSTLDTRHIDLASWPDLWKVEDSDITLGQRIIASIEPFVVELLQHGLTD